MHCQTGQGNERNISVPNGIREAISDQTAAMGRTSRRPETIVPADSRWYAINVESKIIHPTPGKHAGIFVQPTWSDTKKWDLATTQVVRLCGLRKKNESNWKGEANVRTKENGKILWPSPDHHKARHKPGHWTDWGGYQWLKLVIANANNNWKNCICSQIVQNHPSSGFVSPKFATVWNIVHFILCTHKCFVLWLAVNAPRRCLIPEQLIILNFLRLGSKGKSTKSGISTSSRLRDECQQDVSTACSLRAEQWCSYDFSF